MIFARTSEGLYLLQRVRDEAHRFAITHHRSRRSKSMVESLLDDVPGLGEVRRRTLVKHFGSLKKLRAAEVGEIAQVPGIGPRTAVAIKDAVERARRSDWPSDREHRHRRDPRGGLMAPPSTEPPAEHAGEVVVVTGMTGAGRSTAAKELEDLGFYVVDNLPPSLLRDVVRLVDESRGTSQPIAVVVDVRSGAFFDSLQANLAQHAVGRDTTLLFLDATDEVLVRRQEAVRRPHPLQASGRLIDGLLRERTGAGQPAGQRRPGDRHLRPQRPPAHRPDRRVVRHARHDAAQGHGDELRLQVRHPRRRRLRRRHALAAQPLLGAPPARPDRPRRRGQRLRPRAGRRPGVRRPLRRAARRASPRATCARASASCPSPSAVPVASTAAWR